MLWPVQNLVKTVNNSQSTAVNQQLSVNSQQFSVNINQSPTVKKAVVIQSSVVSQQLKNSQHLSKAALELFISPISMFLSDDFYLMYVPSSPRNVSYIFYLIRKCFMVFFQCPWISCLSVGLTANFFLYLFIYTRNNSYLVCVLFGSGTFR